MGSTQCYQMEGQADRMPAVLRHRINREDVLSTRSIRSAEPHGPGRAELEGAPRPGHSYPAPASTSTTFSGFGTSTSCGTASSRYSQPALAFARCRLGSIEASAGAV